MIPPIEISADDYGTAFHLPLYFGDGVNISAAELSIANLTALIWQPDRLDQELPVGSAQVYPFSISPRAKRMVNYWQAGQSVNFPRTNETFLISSVEAQNNRLIVGTPATHNYQRSEPLKRIVFESTTAVTQAAGFTSVVFTPEVGMFEKPGTYQMSIVVETGTRKLTSFARCKGQPYIIQVQAAPQP